MLVRKLMNRTVFAIVLVAAAVLPAIAQQAMEVPGPSKELGLQPMGENSCKR